ncbi:MAG: ubiquinol-cytochrome c reductase iron-sulfur subunit, partial [Planctomycetia bacterium]
AEKPAAKPAAASAPKPAADSAKTGVKRDTASILAAARGAKPGPVSKSEAPEVVAKLAAAAKPKPAAATDKPTTPRAAPPMPVRPAKPAKAEPQEDRRNFLEIALGSFMAVGFTALSVTGGLFSLGLARFMFPNVLAEPPSRFKVGFREGFPAGKVETKFVPQYGVWVVNGDFQGQQQIYALKTVCTHLGCTPNWLDAEQKFKCPCHGSGFYKDGINFEGPAPRPLERYAIRIADDGQLEIDKSKTFQEELGQWADPDSYVTV